MTSFDVKMGRRPIRFDDAVRMLCPKDVPKLLTLLDHIKKAPGDCGIVRGLPERLRALISPQQLEILSGWPRRH